VLTILLTAFSLGVVAGLRSMMAPAAVLLARHVRVAGIVVAILAIGELIVDLLPTTPSRTAPVPLVARLLSGAFCGWFVVTGSPAAPIAGVLAGVAGALVGTYGGHAARARAITRLGAIPAALAEDVFAVALALLAVNYK
jgi:uncharacterized membrane protein